MLRRESVACPGPAEGMVWASPQDIATPWPGPIVPSLKWRLVETDLASPTPRTVLVLRVPSAAARPVWLAHRPRHATAPGSSLQGPGGLVRMAVLGAALGVNKYPPPFLVSAHTTHVCALPTVQAGRATLMAFCTQGCPGRASWHTCTSGAVFLFKSQRHPSDLLLGWKATDPNQFRNGRVWSEVCPWQNPPEQIQSLLSPLRGQWA